MNSDRVFQSFPLTADTHRLDAYRARGGYGALAKALQGLQPIDVEKEVAASGLQGRGGAGFGVGAKWSFVNKQSPVVYLCCNADEGEPGTFKDRWILEHSPHQLLEGMLLASYALRVRNAFVYIRGEFDLPLRRLQGALQEAREAGLVGQHILGSGFSCDIVVHRGAGLAAGDAVAGSGPVLGPLPFAKPSSSTRGSRTSRLGMLTPLPRSSAGVTLRLWNRIGPKRCTACARS